MYGIFALLVLSTAFITLGGIWELACWVPRYIRERRELSIFRRERKFFYTKVY